MMAEQVEKMKIKSYPSNLNWNGLGFMHLLINNEIQWLIFWDVNGNGGMFANFLDTTL